MLLGYIFHDWNFSANRNIHCETPKISSGSGYGISHIGKGESSRKEGAGRPDKEAKANHTISRRGSIILCCISLVHYLGAIYLSTYHQVQLSLNAMLTRLILNSCVFFHCLYRPGLHLHTNLFLSDGWKIGHFIHQVRVSIVPIS
jgi:hypothetical protein